MAAFDIAFSLATALVEYHKNRKTEENKKKILSLVAQVFEEPPDIFAKALFHTCLGAYAGKISSCLGKKDYEIKLASILGKAKSDVKGSFLALQTFLKDHNLSKTIINPELKNQEILRKLKDIETLDDMVLVGRILGDKFTRGNPTSEFMKKKFLSESVLYDSLRIPDNKQFKEVVGQIKCPFCGGSKSQDYILVIGYAREKEICRFALHPDCVSSANRDGKFKDHPIDGVRNNIFIRIARKDDEGIYPVIEFLVAENFDLPKNFKLKIVAEENLSKLEYRPLGWYDDGNSKTPTSAAGTKKSPPLFMLTGMGHKRSNLLNRVGINSIEELAACDPAELVTRLKEYELQARKMKFEPVDITLLTEDILADLIKEAQRFVRDNPAMN